MKGGRKKGVLMEAKVLQFNRFREQNTETIVKQKHSGVIRKPGSKKLYVDIYPNGVRVQKSSGIDDTPENRKRLQEVVDRMKADMAVGVFRFERAFPHASEKEKAIHARLEGRSFKPDNGKLLFERYLKEWRAKNIPGFPPSKQRDYNDALDFRILPYFKGKTFDEITGVTLKDFIKQLNWTQGKKKGQPLSKSRVNSILIALKAVWYDAMEEYQMERSDPFAFIKRFLRQNYKERPQKAEPEVFRFDEWQKILNCINPYYRPIAEFMIMTGMIGSEIAGFKKDAIEKDKIRIENSIVKKHEKSQLKTEYRKRTLPLTAAMKKILDSQIEKAESDYLFTMKTGSIFDPSTFRERTWKTALRKANVKYRVPYTMRHSFAAWSLVLDIHPNRLVKLMGHGSKKMVYDVYGQYVDDIETDVGKIMGYFGNDFK